MPDKKYRPSPQEISITGGQEPAAYTRKDRTPVLIDRYAPSVFYDNQSNPHPLNHVSGEYYPPSKDNSDRDVFGLPATIPNSQAVIRIDVPSKRTISPLETGKVLKHEMIHAILGGVAPSLSNTGDFGTLYPAPGLLPKLTNNPLNLPRPQNSYQFAQWGRAGEAAAEVPAYMGAFEPDKIPINQYQRDTYMNQLYKFMENHGAAQKAARLHQLLDSLPNMEAIYPHRNVGQ